MDRRSHHMVLPQETDFEAIKHIERSLELPAVEEFFCSNEEVREVCAYLHGNQYSMD